MWADIVDDQSFTFQQLLPFFKKSIRFTPPDYTKRRGGLVTYDANAFDPSGGPLHVSYPNQYYKPFSDRIKSAFTSLGFKEIPGFNSGNLLGFSEFTLTIDPRAATRSSSETSFLQATLRNSTLQVYQQTLAKRIVFNTENKSAIGVEVSTAGVQYYLAARKEVILAAGVVCYTTKEILDLYYRHMWTNACPHSFARLKC